MLISLSFAYFNVIAVFITPYITQPVMFVIYFTLCRIVILLFNFVERLDQFKYEHITGLISLLASVGPHSN